MNPDLTDLSTFPAQRDARCPLDPAPEYREWRETEGLHEVNWQGREAWAVSRHEDVTFAMSDPRVSAEIPLRSGNEHFDSSTMPKIFPRMDDPEHAVLRRMLTKDFTVKRIDSMRPEVEKMANDFIDTMVANGSPADLGISYCLPVPSLVISAPRRAVLRS